MTYLSLGRRRRGKTTLLYYMAAQVRTRIIFDPRGMIRRPGSVVVRTIPQLEAAIDGLGDDFHELVYYPLDNLRRVAFPAFTREAKHWIVENPTKPVAVLIDELAFVTTGRLDDDLEWILKSTDQEKVQLLLACHRPADVPVDIRAIADYWCVFHTTQEHDLQVLEERCGPKAAKLAEQLRGQHFLIWNDGDAELTEYRDPNQWYVDLKEGPAIDFDTVELTS